MKKIISLEKTAEGFYVLEYEFKIPFIYKKINKRTIFKYKYAWRYLNTGNELFGNITYSLNDLKFLLDNSKDYKKIILKPWKEI